MSDVMDQFSIINEWVVRLGMHIAEKAIRELFAVDEPRIVWGPKYLVVVAIHPALGDPIVWKLGDSRDWNEKWGGLESYERIARWKAETAQREGKPTSELTHLYPQDHEAGDYLYPGGVVSGKLAVGASGIEGFADEIAANLVLKTIEGLCRLKREQLYADNVHKLG